MHAASTSQCKVKSNNEKINPIAYPMSNYAWLNASASQPASQPSIQPVSLVK